MKIETQAIEDRQVKLTVELDSETLEQFKHRAARKIANQSKIPGFRPGKAPYEVVKRMFGDAALQQEAIEMMVEDVYPKAIEEAKLDVSGMGQLQEIPSFDPPSFVFVIPLTPEVTLGDYQSVRKDYSPEPITEEQIEKTLVRLRRSYSTAEAVERASEAGDLVSFKLSAVRMNPAEGEKETLIEESSYQMVAGEGQEEEEEKWPYPGFAKELVGLTAGYNKSWNYTFGDETPWEDMVGREAGFSLTVENVKAMNLPELTDEFAKTLGEFDSVDALKAAIRTQLEQNYQQQFDQNYFNEVIGEVVSQSTVAYPPHLLDEEVQDFLHGVEHDLEHERLDMETYLKLRGLTREDFIEQEVKPAAKRRLERSLVLSEFAKRESVTVNDDEVRSIYMTAFQQMQQSPELRKMGKNTKRSDQELASSIANNAINNIFNQRLMARLKSLATGQTEEVQPEAAVEVVDAEAQQPEAVESETPVDQVETSEPQGDEADSAA